MLISLYRVNARAYSEWLKRSGVQISGPPNLTQCCNRFAIISTSAQVAVCLALYAESSTANSLHVSA